MISDFEFETYLDIERLVCGPQVSSVEISPDHSLLAYGLDTSGYETYTIFVKDLRTGETHEETVQVRLGPSVCL